MSETQIFKCKQHTIYDPRRPEKHNNTMMQYGHPSYMAGKGAVTHAPSIWLNLHEKYIQQKSILFWV